VDVPVAKLIAKPHARELIKTIDPRKASSSAELGKDIVTITVPPEPDETTHFSVIDKDGMAVSNTYTLEGGYGSHVVIKGTGILLNNEMGDFNKKPGTTNETGDIGTPANVIAPGKRMLSSMTPTIVLRDGRTWLVVGSPGGGRIITTVLQVIVNAIDHGMDVQQAVDAPRFHHQWQPDEVRLERIGFPADVVTALQAMGHTTRFDEDMGDVQAAAIDVTTGIRLGASDPREDGLATGY
jgi:gamma-glutamyltranspeptidase / glutathione hydrolase